MIRLERRVETPRWLSVAVPIGSLFAALLAGAILISLTGNDATDTYGKILDRAFISTGALSSTILSATPLLFTGLAAAAAFRMGVFNIGAEGQFIMGAMAATWVGLAFGTDLGAASIPLMMLAGIGAGLVWSSIAGALKAWFDTNEIITSLMLNYVAANIGSYLIFNSESYLRLLTPSGRQFPQGRPIDEAAHWTYSHIGPVDFPLGFWVGVLAAAFVFVLYRWTRFGFEVSIIGDEPKAARYAGMRTKRKIISVMALSGGLAGLGGASDVGDIRHVFDPKGMGQAGYGYAGIVIAALARLNPLAVIVVAVIMGGLANAGRALQGPDFPAGLVGTLQGLILFCALGGEVLARFRILRTRRAPAGSAGGAGVSGAEPAGEPA